MGAMTRLDAPVRRLADARYQRAQAQARYAVIEERAEKARQRILNAFPVLTQTLTAAREAEAAAEATVREMALAAYRHDPTNKQPTVGVTIRVY